MQQDLGRFGDRRLQKGADFLARLMEVGASGARIRPLGGDRAGEVRFGRLLHNSRVTPAEMIATAAAHTASLVQNLHVLAIQDTTKRAGRSRMCSIPPINPLWRRSAALWKAPPPGKRTRTNGDRWPMPRGFARGCPVGPDIMASQDPWPFCVGCRCSRRCVKVPGSTGESEINRNDTLRTSSESAREYLDVSRCVNLVARSPDSTILNGSTAASSGFFPTTAGTCSRQ
jgi:hypothetical protein